VGTVGSQQIRKLDGLVDVGQEPDFGLGNGFGAFWLMMFYPLVLDIQEPWACALSFVRPDRNSQFVY
jgi:hypothetical protein